MFIKKRISWAIPIAILVLLILAGTVLAEGEVLPEEPAPVVVAEVPTPAGEALLPEEPMVTPGEAALPVEEAAPNVEYLSPVAVNEAVTPAVSDPYFYVGTLKYSFSAADCNPDIAGNQPCGNPIQAAINYIRDHGTIPSDRKVYVEAGTYAETVTIDGMAGTYDYLRLLNGLIGKPYNLEVGYYPTLLNGSLSVHDVINGFTLSGFEITGYVNFNNNIGPILLEDLYVHNSTGHGIDVLSHSGQIKLNRVRSDNNKTWGSTLVNTAGAAAPIIVTNSSFNNNMLAGLTNVTALYISTNGPVTINGVSASNNHMGNGLRVYNASSLTVKNSVFNLNIASPLADEFGYGLYFDTDKVSNVTIENVVADSNNHGGIYVSTLGKISLKNVRASFNSAATHAAGAYLNNSAGTAPIIINGTSNHFDRNATYGLFLRSGGAITLSDLTADYNDWTGLDANTSKAFTLKTASTSGLNTINYNGIGMNWDGMLVHANGAITIQNTVARNNTAYGMALHNPTADITINPVKILRSQANDNQYGGYNINTNGILTMTDSSADDNHSFGLDVDTDNKVSIKCTGLSVVCSFSRNSSDGMYIRSRSSITITNVVANGNIDDGMDLYNVTPAFDETPDPITLTKITVEGNGSDGIRAITENNVLANTVRAVNNGDYGLTIGDGATHANNATVLGTNLFDGNWRGLFVYANGTVIIKNVTVQNQYSTDTTYGGIYVFADGAGKPVLLSNIIARDNTANGISIESAGNITLNSVSAFQNGMHLAVDEGDGLHVINNSGYNLTINNSNFIFNTGNGLDVDLLAWSDLIMNNVNYFGNDSDGDGNMNLFLH